MAQQNEDYEIAETNASSNGAERVSRSSSEALPEEQRVFEHIPPEDREELTRIASNFPRHRATDSGVGSMGGIERKDTLEDVELGDPVLDPTSDQFDHYKWARMVLKMMDKQGVSMRKSTGVVFQNLNISGSGAALQYQNNVGSVPLAPFRAQEYISLGKSVPQKQILRNFDGVLQSGELLIVLGRPGSGCSTLLKSLSGQLHGLKVGESSDVQYNGIPMETMHKEYKVRLSSCNLWDFLLNIFSPSRAKSFTIKKSIAISLISLSGRLSNLLLAPGHPSIGFKESAGQLTPNILLRWPWLCWD